MKAESHNLRSVLGRMCQIEIPFFQRAYVWNEDLWSRLLDDVTYVGEQRTSHFIGSVILKNIGEFVVDGNTYAKKILVDGQQRVTTLLILFKVIALKSNLNGNFEQIVRHRTRELKIIHGHNDIEAFKAVMSMTEPVKIENKESQVIKAYNYFIDNVDVDAIQIQDSFDLDDIIERIIFVCIELESRENEQQIFDTLNSLGVNLTTSELLKNYFFSQTNLSQYEEKWVSVFEKDTETKEYWYGIVDQGTSKRAMIDIFFESYFKLFVQNVMNVPGHIYTISNEDKLKYDRSDNLSLSIQNFISKYCDHDKNVILEHMNEYAEAFKKCFNPNLCFDSISGDNALERLNIVMFGLKSTTMIPYVLYVAKNVEDSDEQDEIYSVLESCMMRRIITRAPTNTYNRLFTSLILNKTLTASDLLYRLKGGDNYTSWMPNDEEMAVAIRDINRTHLQSRGILYLIESSLQGTLSATKLLGLNDYSLEHLMPKKWRNNWPACTSDDVAYNRDRVLLTLGNLAIIPRKLNTSISNANWESKKAGRGKTNGLSKYAAGLCTLQDTLTKEEWNEEEISKRADWLYEQAKEIWKI